ncbi:MAG: helix-turn-helix domain-containing protein [candidate division KSB1 bacterium]|nr:helix-turn-helix domain-containing protein [candidate division KSB1 bacterium]
MNVDDLLQNPESATLAHRAEFDAACIETVAAMATGRGGVILVGITPEGQIPGVQVDAASLENWMTKIALATEPAVMVDAEIHRLDEKPVVVLTIPEMPIKPVAVQGRCYKRLGSHNHLLTPAEVAELHTLTTGRSWDSLPLEAATLEDLDLGKIEKYIEAANARHRRTIDKRESPFTILDRLRLIRSGKLTNAAVLLFGKEPQIFFPQAKIKAGRFKSETAIIDDTEIGGTLIEQIEAAFAFIQRHLAVRLVITGQPQREEVWEYPLGALREGLINAVTHRDYAAGAVTQIRIHDDNLLIWNPGNLPLNLRIDDLKRKHQSVLRNTLIGAIFYDLGYIERWGSGTNRIIEECRALHLPDPEWRENQGLMLTFRKDVFTEENLREMDLPERLIQAVLHVKKNRRISNQQYQELFGVKKRTASEDLHELEQRGILERVGSTGKGTYYKIKGR